MRSLPFALSAAFFIGCTASTLAAQCDVPAIAPPPDAASTKTIEFGRSAGVSGDLAIVGALLAPDTGGSGLHPQAWTPDTSPGAGHPASSTPAALAPHGVAYVYQRVPVLGWTFAQTLLPTGSDPTDDFGASAAIDGTLALVGNPHDDDFGPDSGSVYVYRHQGGSFLLAAKLHAADAAPNARFGTSVAVDADRIIVGAPGASGPFGLPNVGAAYIFEPLGPFSWSEVERISDNFGQPGDGAGTSVGMSGAQALVGAPGHDSPAFGAGAVYAVQQLSPGNWLTTLKLQASDAAPLDGFGASVALEDGAAVIGAPNKSSICPSCGSAYAFASPGPGSWFETAQLGQGTVAGELQLSDGFGTAVGIAGGVVAVSAPHNKQDGIDSGTVFAFQSGGDGYVLTNTVNACDPASGDRFGASLDVGGGVMLSGAPGVGTSAPSRGAAYFATADVIEVASDTIALFFSDPDDAPADGLVADGVVFDAQCAEGPLYPMISVEDHFDAEPPYDGHKIAMRGRIWEMDLIGIPYSGFGFSGPDPSAEEEIYRATSEDCDGAPEFTLADAVQEGVAGKLATFVWTGCEAAKPGSTRGPFEVTLKVFLPSAAGHAQFDLSASALGAPPTDWAFWCGKLNMSIVEDHLGSPDDTFYLLTPFGHLVKNPALNLVGNGTTIPTRADALGRPSNQILGFYDSEGRGLYAAMADPEGNRAKNFQFYGCPGDADTNPTVNIVSLSYQEEVVPGAPFMAVRSFIGRFRGDWFDLADLYRDWLEEEDGITYKGVVKHRGDVPGFAKELQMAVVLNAGVTDYTGPVMPFPGGMTGGPNAKQLPSSSHIETTVPERIDEYMQHYDIDHVLVCQFGTHWLADACAGVGEYVPSELFKDNALLMKTKEAELQAEDPKRDLNFMVYFFDTQYSQTGGSFDWPGLAILNPAGGYITTKVPECKLSPTPGDFMLVALIDPSTPEWQDHMYDVAYTLGDMGVDGIYCDNAFPDLKEYDFSTDHGHPPGFGKYMTEGFAKMFEKMQQGGQDGSESTEASFITYTEFFFEGFIPRSDTYGPEQAWTDWMTADANTTQVPLISALYHHSTILGPPFVGEYTQDTGPFTCHESYVLNLESEAERVKGRIGADYTMAYAWASGCPIWCPDPALTDPLTKRFAYEWYGLELAHKLTLPPGFSFKHLAAVCDFGAELARVRGFPLAEPFLMVGRRLRDFRDFSTTATTVNLQKIPNPYNKCVTVVECDKVVTKCTLGPEPESFPSIVHGVWKDVDTGYVGIALANYTTSAATATFTFDPEEYGWEDLVPVSVYSVSKTGETIYAGHLGGPTVISVTLPAEDALFLRAYPD